MSPLFSSSKRSSHMSSSSSSTPASSFLSRFQSFSSSSPSVYHNKKTPVPRVQRSTEYTFNNNPPPYDGTSTNSPVPTPSTSWTSEMSTLADKIRENHAAIDENAADSLDRKSIAQGMKLIAIAADEFEDGNPTIALEIYLSGIDKILMALPNKTDPMSKQALRDKLTSVEERVGILNIAGQHRPKQQEDWNDSDDKISVLQSFGLSGLISVIANTASVRSTSGQHEQSIIDHSASTSTMYQQQQQLSLPPGSGSSGTIDSFKRFGQVIINGTVALAVLVKQSPLPDIAHFMFNFVVQLLVWIDSQYHIVNKAHDMGIECIKLILKMDEQYHLHELASETMYMFVAAGIKAIVAYKEAPTFQHGQSRTIPKPIDFYKEDCREECQPKPSSRWIW